MSERNRNADAAQAAEAAAQTAPVTRAIEELAVRLSVSKPVFAAVRQYKGWAAGKQVSEAAFRSAVEGFLNGGMRGGK